MACEGLITQDILFDCENASIGGLEVDVLIINSQDIDRTAITYDANNRMLLSGFALKSGRTGYLIKGVKQVFSTGWDLVKKENGPDKKKHIFNGLILTPTVSNKLQLENMSLGGKYVAIVEKKWKGASNAEAFEVFGIESGLELNVASYKSNENDGAIPFELSSVDSYEESKGSLTLLVGDYAATKALFDNKFIQP